MYRESVDATRWFVWLIRLCAIGPVIAAVTALRDTELAMAARVGTIGLGLLGALVIVGATTWFMRLSVEVHPDRLRAAFGPFGRTIPASEVASAEVRPYRWLQYGGWGWRFGRDEGGAAQALSVPFLRTGVLVALRNGKRYYISSRAPEQLAQAIAALPRTSR